jgi:hypothetical protein
MKPLLHILVLAICSYNVCAQRLSRDQQMDVLTNHLGYLPSSTKICVLKAPAKAKFDVVEVTSGQIAYSSRTYATGRDLGEYSIADFSKLSTNGIYYLRADSLRSYPFRISPGIYNEPAKMIVNYFSKQRCGASTTGYLTPCHTDDGIRFDNRKHQDVSGGWHDASDLRKWVSATIYGVMALARAYELQPKARRESIMDELRWGNQYFLKMQEPAGYIMDFVGGDLKRHSDNNRWTDNIAGKEGGAISLVQPNAGKSKALMLVSGDADDRIIQTQPVDKTAQYNFITAQALLARISADRDPEYSKECLAAAGRCYDWCMKSKDTAAGVAGAALQANVEMFKTTRRQKYLEKALELAVTLKNLQASEHPEIAGFFQKSVNDPEPYKNIWEGCQGFIGLCDLVKIAPSHRSAPEWKETIKNYAEKYLLFFAERNAFGIVPFGLYNSKDPGGNRKAGNYWYRYFMFPEEDWWVGVNSNLASAGVGLWKAGKLLSNVKMQSAAQRQLDWILGCNPFSSSTLIGAGYNHPVHFPGSTFLPGVPEIPGAVMNGLGGNEKDVPVIGNGDWQISEYWTPMVAYTLWLMSEMSSN